jgi:cell division protein FtsB
MTAPTKSRRSSSTAAARTATVEPEEAPARRRTTAAERAYARRAQRADLLRQRAPKRPAAERETVEAKPRTRLKLRWPRSRASFVLVMMGLLAVGVAATLWFTTQAIADSYRLEKLRTDNAALMETKDRLEREVAKAQSPASLAPAAKQLGMVPGGDPARIVVDKDGKTKVVGDPQKAEAPQGDTAPPPAAGNAPAPNEGGIEGDLPGTPAGTTGGQ